MAAIYADPKVREWGATVHRMDRPPVVLTHRYTGPYITLYSEWPSLPTSFSPDVSACFAHRLNPHTSRLPHVHSLRWWRYGNPCLLTLSRDSPVQLPRCLSALRIIALPSSVAMHGYGSRLSVGGGCLSSPYFPVVTASSVAADNASIYSSG